MEQRPGHSPPAALGPQDDPRGIPGNADAGKRRSPARAPARRGGRKSGEPAGAPEAPAERASTGAGKHLVIVESPTKAKTINKYLGRDYLVMASVGHVRDLPARAPKGVKQEVPGVDLEHDFAPTYEVLPAKRKTVADLRKAARKAADVWFATDLDREGEAIAWHLAEALEVPLEGAKRVVFNAITKAEIQHAFSNPKPIDQNKVNAQQARRILDRIVGYQVSPLLWRKVAGGLSAGRVQSVAVRLVVEREREIEAFIPTEYWKVTGVFATDLARAGALAAAWRAFAHGTPADADGDDDNGAPGTPGNAGNGRDAGPTLREKVAWLAERACLRAELVELDGRPAELADRDSALAAARRLGFVLDEPRESQDPRGKGPARFLCAYRGHVDPSGPGPAFAVRDLQSKPTTVRPPAPFITSTLQQAAANQLGFPLQRTMRIAQQLYEGVDLGGSLGQTGLITYMRTDSTHLSGEALSMVRGYIGRTLGDRYLPAKPNFFSSSNKAAQEAHEAIRPTDVGLRPQEIKASLSEEQFKLYDLIWRRFVACQMTSAEWNGTTVLIECAGPTSKSAGAAVFKAAGRTLVFDGFYKVLGLPRSGEEATLPALAPGQALAPLAIDPTQHFTSPPPRFTEASLQKKLEEEGIGRPSTYAAIIQTIQDRKYVQQLSQRDRRLYASDLGKVVTDKLVEAFPQIMDVGYTREMELELDKVEEEHHDWQTMLRRFYGPFRQCLDAAHGTMTHAKAETEPAPFKCDKCGAPTVYRFGKNGRFLSCSRYPDCDFAAPIDREGNPQPVEKCDILCPVCGGEMSKRVGRFGAFLGCVRYPECKGIVRLDRRKQTVVLPKVPPLVTDLACPKCEAPLNLRRSKRGPWLSCSKFPRCRGRLAWSQVEEGKQQALETALAAHEQANPVPVIKTREGKPVDETYLPRTGDALAGPTGGTDDALDNAV